jgi:hypothetical protein
MNAVKFEMKMAVAVITIVVYLHHREAVVKYGEIDFSKLK